MKTEEIKYAPQLRPGQLCDCGHPQDEGMPANANGKTVQGWTWHYSLDRQKRLCQSCYAREILDCGHAIGGLKHCFTTGYGIAADGKKHCYSCCAAGDEKEMVETGRIVLYLSREEIQPGYFRYSVTNWPGSLRIPCAPPSYSWHNFAGCNGRRDVHFYHKGERWHGVNIGDNEILHCRRLKGGKA